MSTSTPVSSRQQQQRLIYLDLFRGLAVFFMFDAHVTDAIVKLGPGAGRIQHWHNLTFNLPAPGFLFAAGISFGITAYARWELLRGWNAGFGRRIARILEVLFVAYLLHAPSPTLGGTLAAPEQAMRRFLGWDILQCIGFSLLLILGLAAILPNRRWFLWAVVLTTLTISISSSWMWDVNWTTASENLGLPWWITTIFSKQLGSNFPFFPYAAFLFAGAIWGYLFAGAASSNSERQFHWESIKASFCLLGLAVLLILIFTPTPEEFWGASLAFMLIRCGLLMGIMSRLYFLQDRLLPALRFAVILGKQSLFVYFIHLLIVYGSLLNRSLNLKAIFEGEAGFVTWLVVLLMLTTCMTLLAVGWNWAKQKFGHRLEQILWGTAAVATASFVLR